MPVPCRAPLHVPCFGQREESVDSNSSKKCDTQRN